MQKGQFIEFGKQHPEVLIELLNKSVSVSNKNLITGIEESYNQRLCSVDIESISIDYSEDDEYDEHDLMIMI